MSWLTIFAVIGSKAIPIVKVIIVALYIIAKPISIFLDVVLGQEIGQTYSKEEVRALNRVDHVHFSYCALVQRTAPENSSTERERSRNYERCHRIWRQTRARCHDPN